MPKVERGTISYVTPPKVAIRVSASILGAQGSSLQRGCRALACDVKSEKMTGSYSLCARCASTGSKQKRPSRRVLAAAVLVASVPVAPPLLPLLDPLLAAAGLAPPLVEARAAVSLRVSTVRPLAIAMSTIWLKHRSPVGVIWQARRGSGSLRNSSVGCPGAVTRTDSVNSQNRSSRE